MNIYNTLNHEFNNLIGHTYDVTEEIKDSNSSKPQVKTDTWWERAATLIQYTERVIKNVFTLKSIIIG